MRVRTTEHAATDANAAELVAVKESEPTDAVGPDLNVAVAPSGEAYA
jgi:hypothetical protein